MPSDYYNQAIQRMSPGAQRFFGQHQNSGSPGQQGRNLSRDVLSGFIQGQGATSEDAARALTNRYYLSPQDAARQQGDMAIFGAIQESARIRDEQERVGQEQGQFLTGEFQQANKPTITDEDINRMYGLQADAAAAESRQLLKNLREHLGDSGSRGGTATGQAAAIEVRRYGQARTLQGQLKVFRAEADRQDRLDRYQRSLGLAQARNEFFQPSGAFYQGLSGAANAALTREGIEAQDEASKRLEHSSRVAGNIGAVTGLAGGLLSVFG